MRDISQAAKPVKKQLPSLSKQNQHMIVQYEKVQEAMLALMLMGINILEVKLEGKVPVIEVMNTRHCLKLEAARYATIGRGGSRAQTMRAYVRGCMVCWECDYQIH